MMKTSNLPHYDSVDRIFGVALKEYEKCWTRIFNGRKNLEKHYANGFRGEVEFLNPVIKMNVTRIGFNGTTRPG